VQETHLTEFQIDVAPKAHTTKTVQPKVTFEMTEDEARSVLSGNDNNLDLENFNYDSLTVEPNDTDDLSEQFIAETLREFENEN
jgi:hypothetical protein